MNLQDTLLTDDNKNKQQQRSLTPLMKCGFFSIGLAASIMIFVLIHLSNVLTHDKEEKALKHFEEISHVTPPY